MILKLKKNSCDQGSIEWEEVSVGALGWQEEPSIQNQELLIKLSR